MFNFSKVGNKIAVINNSTKYKRKNKIYINNDKPYDEDIIKEFDNISFNDGELMLSPDKDDERVMFVVVRGVVNHILSLNMSPNIIKLLRII